MSILTYDDIPEKAEATGTAFGPLARFYAGLYEVQISQAKQILDYYRHLLDSLGRANQDFHSFVVGSAIEAPDAQARAWAVRYTAGGLAPTE